jgi:hypothetical protein
MKVRLLLAKKLLYLRQLAHRWSSWRASIGSIRGPQTGAPEFFQSRISSLRFKLSAASEQAAPEIRYRPT